MKWSFQKVLIRSLQGVSVPSWRPVVWVGQSQVKRAARKVRKQDELAEIIDPIELWRTGKEDTKMIRWTRSLQIASAKYIPQAMQWAKEIAEFVSKKYKIQVSVYMDSFGEINTLRWFCDYADLATMEKVVNQISTDQEYWQKVIQASDFILQGSVHDIVMRAI